MASPDSPYLTIIRTDQDIIDANVLVQGNIIDVRTTSQNGVSGNAQVNSRKPGYGEPCYQPLTTLPAASITATTCQCASHYLAPRQSGTKAAPTMERPLLLR